MALAAIGLSALLVPDPFNLWMNIPVTQDGATSFQPTVSSAGDTFDMRALEDCIAVMSACPQDKTRSMAKMQFHLSFTSVLGRN